MPGILLVLAGNGWMRGVQRTREPVVIVLVANALSAVASPVLVYPLGLGLHGSAWANLGRAGGRRARLFLRSLRASAAGGARPCRPCEGQLRRRARPDRPRGGFQVAFLTAAGVAARMGTAQIAAHQIGLQLWEFTALLLDSFAIAAQSLVGAALGSGDADGARRTGLAGVALGALRRRRLRGAVRGRLGVDPDGVHPSTPRCSTRPTCCGRGSSACCRRPASCSPSTAC